MPLILLAFSRRHSSSTMLGTQAEAATLTANDWMSCDVILINFRVEFMICSRKSRRRQSFARLLACLMFYSRSHIIYVEMWGLGDAWLQRWASPFSHDVDLRVDSDATATSFSSSREATVEREFLKLKLSLCFRPRHQSVSISVNSN